MCELAKSAELITVEGWGLDSYFELHPDMDVTGPALGLRGRVLKIPSVSRIDGDDVFDAGGGRRVWTCRAGEAGKEVKRIFRVGSVGEIAARPINRPTSSRGVLNPQGELDTYTYIHISFM